LLMSDGSHSGGADAVLAMAREIWWGRPLVWVSRVPGVKDVLHAAYGSIAARRKCGARQCSVSVK